MFDKYRKTGFERTLFYNYDMVLYTECPKSYRKFVLHLLKNTTTQQILGHSVIK